MAKNTLDADRSQAKNFPLPWAGVHVLGQITLENIAEEEDPVVRLDPVTGTIDWDWLLHFEYPTEES